MNNIRIIQNDFGVDRLATHDDSIERIVGQLVAFENGSYIAWSSHKDITGTGLASEVPSWCIGKRFGIDADWRCLVSYKRVVHNKRFCPSNINHSR